MTINLMRFFMECTITQNQGAQVIRAPGIPPTLCLLVAPNVSKHLVIVDADNVAPLWIMSGSQQGD